MPNKKLEKFRLGNEHDRRIKIPKSDHELVRARYRAGESLRAIARTYGVDKRLIQFILYPERQIAANRLHDWKKYYDRDKWRETMREHRAYKRQIMDQEQKLKNKSKIQT